MDQQTLELLRALQSSERDAGAFAHIRALLPTERARLAAAEDRAALADISELLEVWADSATPQLAAAAAAEAAQIADEDLEQAERAAQLYSLSLERAPCELEPLRKLDALLCRGGQRDRLEAAFTKHADALRVAADADPTAIAHVYRRLGQLRAERGSELGPAIEAYERALDLAVDTDIIRELAELYAKRGAPGDGSQAADLYCTLAEVLEPHEGMPMLERALDQAPGHDAALDLLETFIPAAEQSGKLTTRWAAYIERSDNEPGVDKRRWLLAREYAALGRHRDALVCLGPLIDKGDPEALRLQATLLAGLQAAEQRSSSSGPASKAGNGAPPRPPTLVGFRVPAPDEQSDEDDDEANGQDEQRASSAAVPQEAATASAAAVEAKAEPATAAVAAKTEPAKTPLPVHTEPTPVAATAAAAASRPAARVAVQTKAQAATSGAAVAVAKAEPAATAAATATKKQPQQVPTKPVRVRSARSGETLVGFRLPTELTDLERGSGAAAPASAAVADKASKEKAAAARSSAIQAAVAAARGVPAAKAAASERPRAAQKATPSQPPAAAAAQKAAALRASRASAPPSATPAIAARVLVPRASAAPPRAVAATPIAPASAPIAQAPVVEAAFVPPSPPPRSADPSYTHVLDSDLVALATPSTLYEKRWLIAGGGAVAILAVTIAVLMFGSRQAPPPVIPHNEAAAPKPPPTPAEPIPVAAPVPAPPAPTAAPAAPMATAQTAPPQAPAAEPGRAKKTGSSRARIEPGKAHVVGGGLTAQQVALVLEDSLPTIERCYIDVLEHQSKLQGRLVFGFTIEKNGHPSNVRKLSGTIKDDALTKCSLDALRKPRFPKPKKKASEITWPLDFHKG